MTNPETQIVTAEGFTRGDLSAAFDRVADKGNWKLAIDALVTVADPRELLLIARAVPFFAGCEAEITAEGRGHRVRAVGYYAAVGA